MFLIYKLLIEILRIDREHENIDDQEGVLIMKSLIKNKTRKGRNKTDLMEDLTEVMPILIRKNTKMQRSCLMCGKMFKSKGAFNRRCPKCSRVVELGRRDAGNAPPVYRVSSYGSDNTISNLEEYINRD